MGVANPDQWNDIWLNYGKVARRKVEKFLRGFQFLERVPRDARILDVGCGSGQLLRALKAEGYGALAGIEPEAQLFKDDDLGGIIREGNCLDMGTQPGAQGAYDAVIIMGVLHHMKDLDQVKLTLKNVHAILKDGGTFYSIEPWKNILRSLATFLVRDTFLGGLTQEARMERELLRMEKKELDAWLEVEQLVTEYAPQAGLKVIFYKKDLRYRYITFQKAPLA